MVNTSSFVKQYDNYLHLRIIRSASLNKQNTFENANVLTKERVFHVSTINRISPITSKFQKVFAQTSVVYEIWVYNNTLRHTLRESDY